MTIVPCLTLRLGSPSSPPREGGDDGRKWQPPANAPSGRLHFGVGVAVLAADLAASLAADAVVAVGDGHDLLLGLVVLRIDDVAVLGDADHFQNAAAAHLVAAAAADAGFLVDGLNEFRGPGGSAPSDALQHVAHGSITPVFT